MIKTFWIILLCAACDGESNGPDVPVTVTVMVGGDTGAFAYQDGDAPFVLATPQSGMITFEVTSSRYAFARSCHPAVTRIAYRGASETSLTFPSCTLAPTGADKLTGTIVTAPDAQHYLTHGTASEASSESKTSYPYDIATTGTADFIVARDTGTGALDRLHVERDVAVSGATTRNLMFANLAAPDSIAQETQGNVTAVFTDVMTATSSIFVADSRSPFTYVAFAAGARRASDKYLTSAEIELSPSSRITLDRVAPLPQPFTTFPTANLLDAPKVTGNTATWNRIPGLDGTSAFVSSSPGIDFASFSVGWSDAEAEQRWQVPDLGALVGWPGGFRGAIGSFSLSVTVENKPYPELGYESTTYQRTHGASSLRSNERRRLQRVLHDER